MKTIGLPKKQGMYDPQFEHDACGVGFVTNIKGKKSHEIVQQAITVLENLDHRGAVGSEHNTGDGAGILIQLPDAFFRKVCPEAGFELPAPGDYGVAMLFTSPEPTERSAAKHIFQRIIAEEGVEVIGWREVPTDNSSLGDTAKAGEPLVRQIFFKRGASCPDEDSFNRKLYLVNQRAIHEIRDQEVDPYWYVASISTRTIVYKGMLMPAQLDQYYPELRDPAVESAIAVVHSRFSTNTFPSWDRAHPYHYLAHNGEINTLRGNVNWMHARQSMFNSELFGDDIKKLLPVINTNGSDSAMFDNCLELLLMTGRSLPHAVMMMVPEPWENHETMSKEKRAFYEYHSCLMEPWDGPAALTFTDGRIIGAVLDRNGLRPCRYYLTDDDLVIMASEAGVLQVPPEKVIKKGRLQPGKMFLVDTEQGRIIPDEEIKNGLATAKPYADWVKVNHLPLVDLPKAKGQAVEESPLVQRQKAFGYTFEDQETIIGPMATDGIQPLGSMGTDTPLAVLSEKPQLLYSYFKQLFAQVTNPPIDPIREEIITATAVRIGSETNLLKPSSTGARVIRLEHPLLTNEELEKLRELDRPGFKSATLSLLFKAADGAEGMEKALDSLFSSAIRHIEMGTTVLILSDRGVNEEYAALPALLAVAGLHHHLIRTATRTHASLILESGEPREVHHFAVLLGYGVTAINPYLAFESIEDMIQQGMLPGLDYKKGVKNFVKASIKGIVKTMAKMGISTIQSYRGAQICEAVGLHQSLIEKYFTWTPSRIGGIDLDGIAQELLIRHRKAYPQRVPADPTLDPGGQYQWRKEGEEHLFNPLTIQSLQKATRTNDYKEFKVFSKLIDEQNERIYTLRGLLDFNTDIRIPVPIDEVESVEEIMKRFKTGAMSYGSISQEAHEALAIAMNRIGGRSNTGEGGEDPERFTWTNELGDSKNSAIKQVASGRFGVTSNYLTNANELQIKMAQGAKPGEGGELPGSKVYPWVAKTRHTTPGVGLVSPPPHHDIYSIEDLAELIHDLKNANRRARISVKLVSEVGVGTIAAGVAKAHADVVLISGYDGGTGASPLSSIKHAGLPWELGLAETHQTLMLNNLRSRIIVEVDGQLKTGRDVAIAALLGAEEFGFATAPLVTLGCVMMRVCHSNTCPAGVATQDPELRKNFSGKPEYVVNYMRFIAQEVREIMAELGFRTFNEMVGRANRLEPKRAVAHWKAQGLDFSNVLYQPQTGIKGSRYCTESQDHGLDKSLDMTRLLEICKPAIEKGEKVSAELPITNIDRVVGTIVGNEVTRAHGAAGLPDDTIRLKFRGSAGQSFGAFVPKGMTLELTGDVNDYLGKGLSGGTIVVYPPDGSPFKAEENIIAGNVALYGATSGTAYISGIAGERFCVRNSGVDAVVEGVGDHGCEYMTGGTVVVLGETGRNFAAGMSGGIAYVLDSAGDFKERCNTEMVALEQLDEKDLETLREMILQHAKRTGSARATRILHDWKTHAHKFVKVMPMDYKRVLQALERAQASGLTGDDALAAAFEENAHQAAH
ncbi:glutamate synthase large subunit [Geomonas sp. Red69]|uniref:Glutamate synthase large subunit n=1 Tax=Geomonas diazotrophica TaxID=2843197 RepID=A0ABX8JN25_9BACT|nr:MULTISPECIES: glutamate synthase large subunit [Geomonas]MBU5636885.1 glutamate synthase large subunit [Geomonas diazotrophica]QWV98782.1 glutamate synthase large subunit [Geomonas nitrogeniifigens]QXE87939.1 glutamate synthase large subunit [Geomonas nitrogeniifigens]